MKIYEFHTHSRDSNGVYSIVGPRPLKAFALTQIPAKTYACIYTHICIFERY